MPIPFAEQRAEPMDQWADLVVGWEPKLQQFGQLSILEEGYSYLFSTNNSGVPRPVSMESATEVK